MSNKVCFYCQKPLPKETRVGRPRKYCSEGCHKAVRRLIQLKYYYTTGLGYKPRRAKLRQAVIALLGGKCVSCGISDVRVLQIDHINSNGAEDRKIYGAGQPAYYQHILDCKGIGYQLLCANCNWLKRYERREYGKSGKPILTWDDIKEEIARLNL